jgi:hypothetical protein
VEATVSDDLVVAMVAMLLGAALSVATAPRQKSRPIDPGPGVPAVAPPAPPDRHLLDALREVDAMFPGTPPISPQPPAAPPLPPIVSSGYWPIYVPRPARPRRFGEPYPLDDDGWCRQRGCGSRAAGDGKCEAHVRGRRSRART